MGSPAPCVVPDRMPGKPGHRPPYHHPPGYGPVMVPILSVYRRHGRRDGPAPAHDMTPTRPLNILQIVSGREINGAVEHCRILSRQLCRHQHRVTIMCRRDSWLAGRVGDSPVQVVQCDMNRWPPQSLRRMAGWVSRQQFDVIHTHMSRAHMYGILLSRLTGLPVVATAHSWHFQPHWHLNHHVIANSRATLNYHRRVNRLNPRRSSVVHCFVDTERFSAVAPYTRTGIRRQWRVAPDQPVVGLVGDVVPHKGQAFLLEALPGLLDRFPNLQVVVVGRFHRNEAYTRQLRRFQLKHGLLRRVRWIGRRDNTQDIMSALDVLAVPSLVESMGMVALEGMAVGTPVVAARTGGLPEMIRSGWNGLLVRPRDARELGEAIGRMLADRELRQQCVDNGRRQVAADFGPDHVTGKIEKIYSDLSESRDSVIPTAA